MGKWLGFFVFITILMGALGAFLQGAQGGIATTTAAALTATATARVNVTSTNGFKTAGRLVIRNEIIRYTGKGTSGSVDCGGIGAPCFTSLTRGVAGSQAVVSSTGSVVYDDIAGYANLGSQYQTAQVQNEFEQAGRVTLNPLSWGHMIESVTQANKTFLTGNWKLVMLPWYAFTVGFFFALALAMAGLVRSVFLRQ